MKSRALVVVCAAVLAMAASDALAQRGGGGRAGFGGRAFGMGGNSLMAIASVDAVQKELGLEEGQVTKIDEAQQEMREARRGQGQGGGFGGGRFQDMTEEERAEAMTAMRERQAEREKQEKTKLAEILDEKQMARLDQISLQQQGAQALLNKEVAEKVGLDEAAMAKVAEASEEAQREMRTAMRDAFQDGDREAMQEKMVELRKQADETVLAVLTDEQKKKFEELKGEAFAMPADAFRRGGRNRNG